MEEYYDDDDFSDLYADVEMQASSAMSALNRLMEVPPDDVKIPDNATRGDGREGDVFSGAVIATKNGAFYECADGGEDEGNGMMKLPLENGDSHGDKRIFDGSCGTTRSSYEFPAVNMRKCDGWDEEEGRNGSQRKNLKNVPLALKTRRVVDEITPGAYKNGDDNMASDKDLCVGIGGGKIASERHSSHAYAHNTHCEVSECSSDGTHVDPETSNDTNRRTSSSMFSSEPSATEPESKSTQSEWSQYSQSSIRSGSPCASLSDSSYTDNSCKQSKIRVCPMKESKRLKSIIMKGSDEQKNSDDKFGQKTYDRCISRGEQGPKLNFGSKEKDMFYCYRSGSSVSYSNGFYSRGHSTYLENGGQNIHSSFKYRAGWRDSRDMSGSHNIPKRSFKMEYEALKDDWYRIKRRHVRGNIEHSRIVIPKYSSAAGMRDNQLSNRYSMHFGWNSEGKCESRFIEGKYGRHVSSGERNRDQPSLRYGRDMANNGRGREISERGKRKHDCSLDSSYKSQYMKTLDNDRRYIKHRPMTFYSYKEPCAPDREKHLRFGERQKQLSTNSYAMKRNMKDCDGRDYNLMERCHQRKALHSNFKVYNSRHQELHSEGLSYNSERYSWDNVIGDRHAFGDVSELIDEREVGRHRINLMGDHNSQFDRSRHSVQMHQGHLDTVDFRLVAEGKKITSEAGNHRSHGRHNLREWNDNQRPTNFQTSDDFKPENSDSKDSHKAHYATNQKDEFLDIEEGQIITEENYGNGPVKCDIASKDVASNGDGVVEGLGDDKILEIIAKMEKRRERFQEPITSSRDAEKICSPLFDLDNESAEKGKLGRPARKRRWF
ncbi:fip1 motif-containing protein [Striga asiatica]|uniref:Fip1 motif-containing protein n=1 Tax=Striga asiatica TaxID=4170 RepID=A0A5A7NZC5_STRAF|nr:fip1 motif-containing protein [Striga asiatica]